MFFTEPITECGIILLNKTVEKFLIIYQNESSKWGLPKGHMEQNEQNFNLFFNCAKRELLEETGIMINTHKYKKMGVYILKNKMFFVIRLLKDIQIQRPLDQHEVGAIMWLPIKEIFNFSRLYNCNITLRETCRYISTIYQYHHKNNTNAQIASF
jgi:8-oxo-dGTP pyrophosphatase MutT (NUDIX family)|tara:strand:+ start:2634 stop:3098 length:465 start_codon:yes stop_codon:yes gene_type:complete